MIGWCRRNPRNRLVSGIFCVGTDGANSSVVEKTVEYKVMLKQEKPGMEVRDVH